MKILIIDDAQERHEYFRKEYGSIDNEVSHAHSYHEAIDFINKHDFDLICFDHDLNDFSGDNGKEMTGASIARYMADNGLQCKEARVHSNNIQGAKNIISILKSGDVCPNAYYEPMALFPGANMKGLKDEYET